MSENMKNTKKLLATLPIALLAITILSLVPVTHAYGNSALWQVTLSFNCDNPSLCGGNSNVGGFWGWVEFDSGSQGDATLTGCGHVVGGTGGPFTAGAGHANIQITSWDVTTVSFAPVPFLTIELGSATFSGAGTGSPVTVPFVGPFPLAPAAPGHYSSLSVFGIQAPPGTNFEITVVQLK